ERSDTTCSADEAEGVRPRRWRGSHRAARDATIVLLGAVHLCHGTRGLLVAACGGLSDKPLAEVAIGRRKLAVQMQRSSQINRICRTATGGVGQQIIDLGWKILLMEFNEHQGE